jgi:hypothetical protein
MNVVYVVNVGSRKAKEESKDFGAFRGLYFSSSAAFRPPGNVHDVHGRCCSGVAMTGSLPPVSDPTPYRSYSRTSFEHSSDGGGRPFSLWVISEVRVAFAYRQVDALPEVLSGKSRRREVVRPGRNSLPAPNARCVPLHVP